ncbi:MAG: dipeptidase, partial [Clostridia bacterium]|nr:dipeptidase [Clostridia bacterium]
MIYTDLHCDSVTACCKKGQSPDEFSGQINTRKLSEADCIAQCFAIFTEGENAAGDFDKFLAFYNAKFAIDPRILPVERYSDIEKAQKEGKTAAILTVENMGFLNGDLSVIESLKNAGVKKDYLVWNNANALAFPNLIFKDNFPDFSARENRGLTPLGKKAVEMLNENRIIVDVSHLSDGGAEDILALSSAPIVASHSNCAEVCNVSRNLTDGQIKKIADKGGVAGLNFCRDFIGGDDPFEMLYNHYKH